MKEKSFLMILFLIAELLLAVLLFGNCRVSSDETAVFFPFNLFSKELKSRFDGFFTLQRETSPPTPLHRKGEQGAGFSLFFFNFCLFVGKGRKRPLLTVFNSS